MKSLTLDSIFSNNAVFILDGLKTTDLQTAKHLHDELLDLKYQTDIPYCKIIKTPSKNEFLSALDRIKQLSTEGIRPIVHIEAHGDKNYGIFVGDAEEQITWAELTSSLGKINAVTKNNLGVVMAGCYGIYAIKPIKIANPSPFYFLIGSENEVTAGKIDDVMKKFYKILFQSGALPNAMKEVGEQFIQFHVEKMFCIAFGRYYKHHCIGKGRTRRIEGLVTEAMTKLGSNRKHLRSIRKSLKQQVKPDKATFHRFANKFMHGRYRITYEQVLEFATN